MATPPALKAILDASKATTPQSASVVPSATLPPGKTAQINSGVSIGAQSPGVPANPAVNINIGAPPATKPLIPNGVGAPVPPNYTGVIAPPNPNPGVGDWIGEPKKKAITPVVPPVVKPVVPATPAPATGIPGSPEQIKAGEAAAAKNLADLAAEAEKQKQTQKTNEDLLIAQATSANVDKQKLLTDAQTELTRLTEEKNKLIASSGDIQKEEVKNAYDANQRAIDLQRKKVAQQFQDLQDEQELANVQAKVRDETKTGLIYGGFGSDAANKNIEDTIARGVKALQIVKRDSINSDTEIQNKVLELNDAYATDMNKIEQWKSEQVNSNYEELSKHVMQIKSDKLTSETDKNTAITNAITNYNTKVAEISASVAQTKYNLGQSLITRSDSLTQEMFQNKITTDKVAEEKRVNGINEARTNLDLLLNTYSTQKFTVVPADVKNKMLDLEKLGGLPQGFSKQAFEVAKAAAEKKDTVEKEFTNNKTGEVTLVRYNWNTQKLETKNLGQIGNRNKATSGDSNIEVRINPATNQLENYNITTGKFIGTPNKNLPNEPVETYTIGSTKVKAQPILIDAFKKADTDFSEATGNHIEVNQSYRTAEEQSKLYTELSAKGARVAPPGTSFHEKGLAIDVTNWQEAQPYLAKYGLVNGLEDDMGHFSMGEMNPVQEKSTPEAKSEITPFEKTQRDKLEQAGLLGADRQKQLDFLYPPKKGSGREL